MKEINTSIVKPMDRKMIKNTILLFVILTTIFAAMTIVSAVLMPRQTVYKDVAGKDIIETALFNGKSGEDYFMASGSTFERHSFSDDEVMQSENYLAVINSYVEKEGVTLLDGSLKQFYFLYADKEGSADNLVIIDNLGNLFKYTEGEDGLEFSEDCLFRQTPMQMLEMISDGDDLYILSNYNNRLLIQNYDLNNISAGEKNSRYIWTVEDVGQESSTLSFLSHEIQLHDFVVEGDYLYVATDLGLFKLKKDFCDYKDVKFFHEADTAYVDYLRNMLKSADAQAKAVHELTNEKIDSMTQTQMVKIFKDVTGIKTSEAKKEAATAFVEANDWCVDYEASAMELEVKNECIDSESVSVVKGSMYVILQGMAYSSQNKMFYITNSYDDMLYGVSIEDINSVQWTDNKNFGDIANKIEISFEGRKFHETKSLEWNENANSLYVTFASDDTLCMIDLNDTKPYVKACFRAGFDIQECIGDKTDDKLYFLNSHKTVDIKNNIKLHNYVTCVSPERSENMGTVRTLLIVCAALTVVSALILFSACRIYKNPASEMKARVIKRDLFKNKFTYLALLPFVALLILFCYYEAVGSFSLSFFDYTRDDPTMDWNNFGNYIRIFNDDDFLLAVGNTLFFMVFDIIIAIVPPVIFAFFLSVMRNKKYSYVVRTAMLIPSIIPGVASMLIWRVGIFGETGVLNKLMSVFGQESIAWLENTSISRWSLLLMAFPFVGQYLIFYGAMMNIPKDYYEVAELEGISIFRRFISIDLPLCVPQIVYVFITTMITSAQNYARTYMLRSSGTVTLSEKMYRAMTSKGADYGLSSAYAIVIFALLFVALIINLKMQKKDMMGDSL